MSKLGDLKGLVVRMHGDVIQHLLDLLLHKSTLEHFTWPRALVDPGVSMIGKPHSREVIICLGCQSSD